MFLLWGLLTLSLNVGIHLNETHPFPGMCFWIAYCLYFFSEMPDEGRWTKHSYSINLSIFKCRQYTDSWSLLLWLICSSTVCLCAQITSLYDCGVAEHPLQQCWDVYKMLNSTENHTNHIPLASEDVLDPQIKNSFDEWNKYF